jgi:hypothetical protein
MSGVSKAWSGALIRDTPKSGTNFLREVKSGGGQIQTPRVVHEVLGLLKGFSTLVGASGNILVLTESIDELICTYHAKVLVLF